MTRLRLYSVAALAAFTAGLAMALLGIGGQTGLGAERASAATATTSGKGKKRTKVTIDFVKLKDGFRYEVDVVGRKPCRRHRRFIVWHDENRNGKLDKREFVIRMGKTDQFGNYDFKTTAGPPKGDKIGVVVKGNKKCKRAKASTTA